MDSQKTTDLSVRAKITETLQESTDRQRYLINKKGSNKRKKTDNWIYQKNRRKYFKKDHRESKKISYKR